MFRLLPYLQKYKKESIIGPLFKLLEVCFELVVPLIMAKIIDVGIRDWDMGYVLSMGAVLVGLGLLGLCCSMTAQYFAAKAAIGFGTELRHDMFVHIEGLSYTEIDLAGNSTLVTRMTSDINQVQSGVNLVLRLLLRSPFIVIGAMILAFTIDLKEAMVFTVAMPVMAVIVYGLMVITIPLYKKVQKGLDKVLLSTRENLSGIRVIRAFGTQESEKKEFEEENQYLLAMQMLVGKLSALLNPLTYIVVNIAIVAVVWVGGVRVDNGVITQGEVIALISYMTQILLALVALSTLIVTMTKSFASASRINEVLDLKPSIHSGVHEVPEPAGEEHVRMDHVSFVYAQAKEEALSDICFSVKRGETVGIIGGTGSGKSTLIQLIPRFYDAVSGQVSISGMNVRECRLEELRKRVGLVPQKAVLFHGTIRDNMKMGNELATDEEIFEALKAAQAWEVVSGKKEGLDYVISEGGKNLSGGQRQRLTIARALVRSPEILILDDSASALDFATDARLRQAIAGLSGRMTVFIVSQRASSIMKADQIIVLDDGSVAGIGTHKQLLDTCSVYQEICYSQISKEEASGNE